MPATVAAKSCLSPSSCGVDAVTFRPRVSASSAAKPSSASRKDIASRPIKADCHHKDESRPGSELSPPAGMDGVKMVGKTGNGADTHHVDSNGGCQRSRNPCK